MSKPKTTNPFRSAPLKPGQHLMFKPQLKELLGGPSDSTLWGWMKNEGFPLPFELGPAGGRSTTVAWLADEVFNWIKSRPRRQLGQHEFRGKPKAAAPGARLNAHLTGSKRERAR